MVPGQSMSPGRGRRVRALRSSAPRDGLRGCAARAAPRAPATLPTTRRAVSRLFAGTTPFSASSVVTSSRSGSTASSSSGSSRSWRRPAPLDGVALHDAHDAGREVGAGRRRASVRRGARRRRGRRAAPAVLVALVEGAQGGVELGVPPRQRAVGGVVGRLAEHQAPAPAGSSAGTLTGRLGPADDRREHRQHARRARASSRRSAARRHARTAHRSGARPRRRSVAARPRRTGERAAHERQGAGKVSSGSAASHASIRPSRRASCSSRTPEPREEAVEPGRRLGRLGAGGQRAARGAARPRRCRAARRPAAGASPGPRPARASSPPWRAARAPRSRPRAPPARSSSAIAPCTASMRARISSAASSSSAEHAAPGRPRCAPPSPDQDDEHALRVGAADVAVAGHAGERRQRVHERDGVGRHRRAVAERLHRGLGGPGAGRPAASARAAPRARRGRSPPRRLAAAPARSPPPRPCRPTRSPR